MKTSEFFRSDQTKCVDAMATSIEEPVATEELKRAEQQFYVEERSGTVTPASLQAWHGF